MIAKLKVSVERKCVHLFFKLVDKATQAPLASQNSKGGALCHCREERVVRTGVLPRDLCQIFCFISCNSQQLSLFID